MRYAISLASIALLLSSAHGAHAQSEPAPSVPADPNAAGAATAVPPAGTAVPPAVAAAPPVEMLPPPAVDVPVAPAAPAAPVTPAAPAAPDAPAADVAIEEPDLQGIATDSVSVPGYPSFRPKARLIMGAELRKVHPTATQSAEDNRQPFFLGQARLGLDIEASEMFSGSFSAELDGKPVIRDAYVNLKLARKFQIRAGQFKRPISRIELTSTGKLPFRDRGLFNRFILRDEQWGNRSLGVMLWGRFKSARLSWYAAVMNANDTVDTSAVDLVRGADALGRIEYEATDWLSIAVNGGYKVTELYADGPNLNMFALGGDVQLHTKKLRVVLESIAAQNPNPPMPPPAAGRTPFAAGVIGYATYDIELGSKVIMQPALLGEWYDPDTEFTGDQSVHGVAGLNFLFCDRHLRVLPQVELVRPLSKGGARNQVKLERYYLMLSAEL